MAIDIPATKQNMEMINKRAFARKMAAIHPEDKPILAGALTQLLNGYYPPTGPRYIQMIGYLREAGFLVEVQESSMDKAA